MAHKNLVWIADEKEAFVKANILSKDDSKVIVQHGGTDLTLSIEEAHAVNPDNQDGVNDNTELM